MANERTDDTLLTAKTTIRKKDSKGRDVLKIYLNPEETEALLTEIQAAASKGERGINLTLHTGKKEYEGRSFDSTFFFVKTTGDSPNGPNGGGQKRFVPRKPIEKQVA